MEVSATEITVFADGAHVHFESSGKNLELVEQVFGFVRDLLSPDMGVRELLADRKPFRWFIERFDG